MNVLELFIVIVILIGFEMRRYFGLMIFGFDGMNVNCSFKRLIDFSLNVVMLFFMRVIVFLNVMF